MIIVNTLFEAKLAAIEKIIESDVNSITIKFDKEKNVYIIEWEVFSDEDWDAIFYGN